MGRSVNDDQAIISLSPLSLYLTRIQVLNEEFLISLIR
jgi:hypothetical protein